jgi:hypothetical protein
LTVKAAGALLEKCCSAADAVFTDIVLRYVTMTMFCIVLPISYCPISLRTLSLIHCMFLLWCLFGDGMPLHWLSTSSVVLCGAGMDFYVVLERPGYRVARRRQQKTRVGVQHKVTKEDAIKW